jgi:mRNA-degrading endonuclease toxin of MazEF toxin-antitoxin module
MLILTRDEHIDRQLDVIAVPATSTIRGWDTEVELGLQDGMPVECVLSVGNTSLTQKTFLTQRITRLGPEKMDQICRALARATGC